MIDITNVINITIADTPKGLADYSVNNVAIFSNETDNFLDAYRVYTNARDVAVDFGSSSITAQMAQAIFSQTPNILSGGGSLIIVPMLNAVSATAGNFETADISANVNNFKTIVDGCFNIKLNGGTIKLIKDINFSGITSVADIATILQSYLLDVVVTVDSTSKMIILTSKKFGDSSKVEITAGTGGTDLTANNLLDIAGDTSTIGEESTGESLRDAITRVENNVFFTGLLTTVDLEDSEIIANATAIQAKEKVLMQPLASSECISWFNTNITQAKLTKTRGLLYLGTPTQAKLYAASYMGRGFSVNFNGSKTLHTIHLKDLSGIIPDANINPTLLSQAENAGLDVYVSVAGVPCCMTSGQNSYFDEIYSNIWLKLALQVTGFNYLKQTNTKVPQIESGMDGLKGAYNKVCEQGI